MTVRKGHKKHVENQRIHGFGFLYYLFNNTNKRYLGIQSIARIYPTCSRNDSTCLLQISPLQESIKGIIRNNLQQPAFLLFPRLAEDTFKFDEVMQIVTCPQQIRRGLKNCGIFLFIFIFIILDRLTVLKHLNHQLIYFLLF